MTVRLYLDHNVPAAVCEGLRQRGVDVVSALEEGTHGLEDPDLFEQVVKSRRVMVTHDDDFVAIARMAQQDGTDFPGVVYVHQKKLSIGRLIEELEIRAQVGEPDDFHSQLVFL